MSRTADFSSASPSKFRNHDILQLIQSLGRFEWGWGTRTMFCWDGAICFPASYGIASPKHRRTCCCSGKTRVSKPGLHHLSGQTWRVFAEKGSGHYWWEVLTSGIFPHWQGDGTQNVLSPVETFWQKHSKRRDEFGSYSNPMNFSCCRVSLSSSLLDYKSCCTAECTTHAHTPMAFPSFTQAFAPVSIPNFNILIQTSSWANEHDTVCYQ